MLENKKLIKYSYNGIVKLINLARMGKIFNVPSSPTPHTHLTSVKIMDSVVGGNGGGKYWPSAKVKQFIQYYIVKIPASQIGQCFPI